MSSLRAEATRRVKIKCKDNLCLSFTLVFLGGKTYVISLEARTTILSLDLRNLTLKNRLISQWKRSLDEYSFLEEDKLIGIGAEQKATACNTLRSILHVAHATKGFNAPALWQKTIPTGSGDPDVTQSNMLVRGLQCLTDLALGIASGELDFVKGRAIRSHPGVGPIVIRWEAVVPQSNLWNLRVQFGPLVH